MALKNFDVADVIAFVNTSPEAAWKIRSKPPLVLGPWRANKGHNWSMPGEARFLPKGEDSVLQVYKSQKLREPQEDEFYEWGGVDWDGLETAKKEYQEELKKFQEWTWVFKPHAYTNRQEGYASSKEEAITIVENIAKTKGYMLYNE